MADGSIRVGAAAFMVAAFMVAAFMVGATADDSSVARGNQRGHRLPPCVGDSGEKRGQPTPLKGLTRLG